MHTVFGFLIEILEINVHSNAAVRCNTERFFVHCTPSSHGNIFQNYRTITQAGY